MSALTSPCVPESSLCQLRHSPKHFGWLRTFWCCAHFGVCRTFWHCAHLVRCVFRATHLLASLLRSCFQHQSLPSLIHLTSSPHPLQRVGECLGRGRGDREGRGIDCGGGEQLRAERLSGLRPHWQVSSSVLPSSTTRPPSHLNRAGRQVLSNCWHSPTLIPPLSKIRNTRRPTSLTQVRASLSHPGPSFQLSPPLSTIPSRCVGDRVMVSGPSVLRSRSASSLVVRTPASLVCSWRSIPAVWLCGLSVR